MVLCVPLTLHFEGLDRSQGQNDCFFHSFLLSVPASSPGTWGADSLRGKPQCGCLISSVLNW